MKCQDESKDCDGEVIGFIDVISPKLEIECDFCVWHANQRWGFTQEDLNGLKRPD